MAELPPGPSSVLVLDEDLHRGRRRLMLAQVAAAIGVSRATTQRYLAGLAAGNEVTVGLRYGTAGGPEQEFAATGRPSPDR
jgi:response regulator of citrate/malate metabolism